MPKAFFGELEEIDYKEILINLVSLDPSAIPLAILTQKYQADSHTRRNEKDSM